MNKTNKDETFLYNYDIQFWVTYEGVWIKKKSTHPIPYTHQGMKEFFVSDFREKFTSCSLWLLEFRSVGIFAISLLLTKIWLFLNFQFLTVYSYLMKKNSNFVTEYCFCPPELRSVGIFKISLKVF